MGLDTVYIVITENFHGDEKQDILGVYSSREKAAKVVDQLFLLHKAEQAHCATATTAELWELGEGSKECKRCHVGWTISPWAIDAELP